MMISPRAMSALTALTATFDDPDIDLARTLKALTDQVDLAVPSFLGVSVHVTTGGARIDLASMDTIPASGIGSSLTIPAQSPSNGNAHPADASSRIELILYAAAPGALVDLAADLGFLMSLPLSAFALDQHLDGPEPTGSAMDAISLVDQAIGVLLGLGRTPEQAENDIADQASAGVSREAVAAAILADRVPPAAGPDPEIGHSV